MKYTRSDLWLWRIRRQLPPGEFWAVMIPVVALVVTGLVTFLWRLGEIR
jgi:hypothetical protein